MINYHQKYRTINTTNHQDLFQQYHVTILKVLLKCTSKTKFKRIRNRIKVIETHTKKTLIKIKIESTKIIWLRIKMNNAYQLRQQYGIWCSVNTGAAAICTINISTLTLKSTCL